MLPAPVQFLHNAEMSDKADRFLCAAFADSIIQGPQCHGGIISSLSSDHPFCSEPNTSGPSIILSDSGIKAFFFVFRKARFLGGPNTQVGVTQGNRNIIENLFITWIN